jgi:hypothetical protein
MNDKQRRVEMTAIRWVLANHASIMALLKELQRILNEDE